MIEFDLRFVGTVSDIELNRLLKKENREELKRRMEEFHGVKSMSEHHTDWVTTYPFDVLMGEAETKSKGDVEIGNDVWIGNNVQILSGVTIGDGAVIGAGCVIAKDVDPYTIMIGNPARILTKRDYGSPPIAWWDLPLEKIAEIIPFLCSRNMMELMEAIS